MLKKFGTIVKDMRVYPENMAKNLNNYGELIHAQGLMLTLTDKGLTREEAYALTQKAAMDSRESQSSFKIRIKEDTEIQKFLSTDEIEACFSNQRFTKNVDYIFKRAHLI